MAKNTEDNIVVFNRDKSKDEAADGEGEVMELGPNILFQHASIVDIQTGSVRIADILIVGNRIKKITYGAMKDVPSNTMPIDLRKNYVLPIFVNGYANTYKAYEQTYGREVTDKSLVHDYFQIKHLTAGCGYGIGMFEDDVCYTLENIAEKTEKELSDISEMLAKDKRFLFIRAGLDLQELGTIEKKYGKPLSQVLEDFGLLDRKCSIVGGNCFEKDDWQLFKSYNCGCVVCPEEDAKVGRRPVNLVMLKNLGIDVTIGTGLAFEVDYFAYMRQILNLQRCMFETDEVLSEKDVLRMAITGSSTLCCDKENREATELMDDEEVIKNWVFLENSKVKESNYANLMVIRKDPDLYDDTFKNLVWGKSKQDVLFTVMDGHIMQVCGVTERFDSFDEQDRFIEKLKRTRRKKK